MPFLTAPTNTERMILDLATPYEYYQNLAKIPDLSHRIEPGQK